MRTVYAMKLNVTQGKFGKRPAPETPVEPMLIQLGPGEILALCVSSDAITPESSPATQSPPALLKLEEAGSVNMEVRKNGTGRECVLTITMPLN